MAMQSQSPLRENETRRHQALPDESSAPWRYQQPGPHGHLRVSGIVRGSRGCEEACVHAELAYVIYDLLVWAQTAQKNTSECSTADGPGSAA